LNIGFKQAFLTEVFRFFTRLPSWTRTAFTYGSVDGQGSRLYQDKVKTRITFKENEQSLGMVCYHQMMWISNSRIYTALTWYMRITVHWITILIIIGNTRTSSGCKHYFKVWTIP
jgi:hypothetical protein